MTRNVVPWTIAMTLLLVGCGGAEQPEVKGSNPSPAAEAGATSSAEATMTPPSKTQPTAARPDVEPPQTERPAVIVNGRELTQVQLEAFKKVYGVTPAAGRWWYDAMSGMYGAEGQAASGFMYAGHDLGPLAPDASRGKTPVFINGRQLTQVEVDYLAWLAGSPVMPGRYWVDGQLNWGYEGVPYPAGNLRLLGAAKGGAGRGGSGGDNTWSGLVGAGNYNDDNTVGYVSIPGVGPIGSYGM